MSLLRIFHVSGSAVSAQSQRLNTVSSNLANADTAAGPDGKSFKARQVVFQTLPMSDDASSVGVVDDRDAAAGGDDVLAARLGHRRSQRGGDGGQIEPQGEAHRGGGAGVVHVVGAGEGE